jgi:hypothetical protein
VIAWVHASEESRGWKPQVFGSSPVSVFIDLPGLIDVSGLLVVDLADRETVTQGARRGRPRVVRRDADVGGSRLILLLGCPTP